MISKKLFAFGLVLLFSSTVLLAQETGEKEEGWSLGGGLGFDFAQMLLINPKVGAGENKIAFGGNSSFNADYKKDRFSWDNKLTVNLGVQKLGSNVFQKTLDEIRLNSLAQYAIAEDKPFGYALDISMLTQLTPTYEGNTLAVAEGAARQSPISQIFSPAPLVIAPGITYKPNENFSVLASPLSYKTIIVANDSIASLGNTDGTASFHGNPFGGTDEDEFRSQWHVKPTGRRADSTLYASNSFQLGATLKATYKNKFLKDAKGNARLGFSSTITLFSDYLNNPQFVDVEWITTTDLFIIKGLSISLGTNLFYDHDILVQVNEDGDSTTGVNGYETTGRRISFTQTLLIKYNFLF